MIRTRQLTTESILYLLIFILGLSLRLLVLDAAPLTDSEAGWAISALDLAGNSMGMSGNHPGYTVITSLLFTLFGSSTFIARLLFATLSSLIVWVPYVYREQLGRNASLAAALAFAVAPGFIAVSRTVASPGIAAALLLLGFALWKKNKPIESGMVIAGSLLFGPLVITGLLGIGLGILIARIFQQDSLKNWLIGTALGEQTAKKKIRQFALGFFPVLLLVSTGLFRYPSGLGAMAGVFTGYLEGWSDPTGQRFGLLFGSLAAYQTIALLFGIAAIIRGWLRKDRFQQALSFWLLGAFLAVFLYPSSRVMDLIWVLPPLWMLASREIVRYVPHRNKEIGWIAYAQAILIAVLFIYGWLNLSGVGTPVIDITILQWRLILLGTLFLFGAVSTVFIGLGWQWVDAIHGVTWGSIVSLAVIMISFSFKIILPSPIGDQELWAAPPLTGQAEMLVETLTDLSVIHTGRSDVVDISSVDDSPSLRWALRNFPQVNFVNDLGLEDNPTIVLAPLDNYDFQHNLAYRGQDFTWWRYPAWGAEQPIDWVRWFTLRETPESYGKLVLWARGDLFPDFEETIEDDLLLPEDMDLDN